MDSPAEIKRLVRERYGEIATGTAKSCCGSSANASVSDDYTCLEGYVPEADLGLGCGLPTEIAGIEPGDTVVDLGSGAGNDVFVARSLAGGGGWVIGIDMTEPMIEKARANAARLGYSNVEFRLGEIENLPLAEGSANVVISNCVLNLVPDKQRAFGEIWRVLKSGGHFSISDIVTGGELPESVRKSAEAYVGCVAGAIERDSYLDIIRRAGFTDVAIARERPIVIPAEIVNLSKPGEAPSSGAAAAARLWSVTVYGRKP